MAGGLVRESKALLYSLTLYWLLQAWSEGFQVKVIDVSVASTVRPFTGGSGSAGKERRKNG